MSIPVTITAALNPTFPEIAGNTHYSHGIRIASDDGTSLKYIILAKFDDTIAGDPLENGDFEFATMGTGTMMQGSAVEFTAGKIDRTSSTAGTLWYESRINRIKHAGAWGAAVNDPACNPGSASSSCGFARHTRIRTDITFAAGDISDVSNMSGVISEGYDSSGSGQMGDLAFVLTATGSLSTTGLSGKLWTSNNISPDDFTTDVLTDVATFNHVDTTCILAGGGGVSTVCGAAPVPLAPTQQVHNFAAPANDTTWINWLSTHGGLGYSAATSLADIQSAL